MGLKHPLVVGGGVDGRVGDLLVSSCLEWVQVNVVAGVQTAASV